MMFEGIGFVIGFLLGALFAIVTFILMKKMLFTSDKTRLNDFKRFNLEIQEIKKFQKKLMEKEHFQNQTLNDLNLTIKKIIVENPVNPTTNKVDVTNSVTPDQQSPSTSNGDYDVINL
ncbi:MAG: hypothetical protein ACLTFB_02580 [Candidatus Phytoplasma pyri]|uniref:hypothetical protein n=1 Tax=Candidatus Phytoplasma pyri TaxID=47566 RepID=UPI003983C95B